MKKNSGRRELIEGKGNYLLEHGPASDVLG